MLFSTHYPLKIAWQACKWHSRPIAAIGLRTLLLMLSMSSPVCQAEGQSPDTTLNPSQGGALAGEVLQQEIRQSQRAQKTPYLFRPVMETDLIPNPTNGDTAHHGNQDAVIFWDVKSYLRSAEKQLAQKHYQDAQSTAALLIQLAPDQPHAYVIRGNARFALMDAMGAIADADQALKLNPAQENAYVLRAASKLYLGLYPDAVLDCNAALHLNPNNAKALSLKGGAELLLGHGTEALELVNHALAINNQVPEAYLIRAITHLQHNNPSAAMADINQALAIDPNLPIAYTLRGFTELSTAQPAAALDNSQQALQLNQLAPEAHQLQGDIYFSQNQLHQGLQAYQTAQALMRAQGNLRGSRQLSRILKNKHLNATPN